MLRTLALLLLLGNGLMLAWQAGWLEAWVEPPAHAQREPARLQRQVNADQVQVLTPVAANEALAAAAARKAAEAAAAAASEPASEPASAPAAGACLEAGPFAAAELPAAEKAMRAAAIPSLGWTTLNTQRKGNFMLYMGRFADEQALERKREELQRLKLETQPLSNWADLQPGLVLGRFDTRAAAEGALAAMVQRGVKTARVVTVTPEVTVATLRIPAADANQQRQLATIKLPPSQLGFVACGGESSKP